jgi:basic membrane lipoprotein Med (substrate-binding protein (PBP1-ABC) superfamily)
MKKKYLAVFLAILILPLFLSGCGQKTPKVDELAEDNKYHYYNNTLGFDIEFPSEFEYYQAQRIEEDSYVDMEFLVPTTDLKYPTVAKGFANPVTIRVYDKNYWDRANINQDLYEKIAEKEDNVYTIKFWEKVPSDWSDKWNIEKEREIKESFKLKQW